jgi:hypothetical protein
LAEVDKIIEQIGFINGQSDEINIYAKCDYDQIYNSDLQTSTEIAEKISLIINGLKKEKLDRI